MKLKLLAISAACAATICMSGCSKQPSGTSPGGGSSLTIAVIPKGTTHDFWKAVHAGAEKAAGELNVKVSWQGPLKEDDREAQIRTVEDFVNSGVSGICLAPLDDTALVSPVNSAVQQKIPVVIFDSDLKSDKYVSFVATDNYKGGQIAGEHMVKLLNGKGRVLVLRYQEGSASTFKRESGFLDALKKSPGIKIVSANQYGGATRDSALRASEDLLTPLKQGGKLQVEGIFCPNESTTFGMMRALENAKVAGSVRFVGFDSADELVEGLKDGHIDALVVQNPMKMGYLSVKTMVESLHGGKVPKRIDTGVELVTRANMNNPDVKDLLNPPVEKWLK